MHLGIRSLRAGRSASDTRRLACSTCSAQSCQPVILPQHTCNRACSYHAPLSSWALLMASSLSYLDPEQSPDGFPSAGSPEGPAGHLWPSQQPGGPPHGAAGGCCPLSVPCPGPGRQLRHSGRPDPQPGKEPSLTCQDILAGACSCVGARKSAEALNRGCPTGQGVYRAVQDVQILSQVHSSCGLDES